MNELENKENQLVTTKELAEVFGVDISTITRAVNKLDAVLHPVCRNSQGGYLFNEQQATLIKQEIQSHHNLQNRQIDNVSTEAEENALIVQAFGILQRRASDLEKKLQLETERANHFETTNRLLMHSMKLYTVTEIAKELGYPSAIELNKILEERGIQYKVNGTWVPTAKFSNLGYFEIKQEVHDNGFVYYDRKVTQEGRNFILQLLA